MTLGAEFQNLMGEGVYPQGVNPYRGSGKQDHFSSYTYLMFPYCCYNSSWVAFFYFLTTFYNFGLLQALFILLFHSSCLNKLMRCLLNEVVRFLGNQSSKWLCYHSFMISFVYWLNALRQPKILGKNSSNLLF